MITGGRSSPGRPGWLGTRPGLAVVLVLGSLAAHGASPTTQPVASPTPAVASEEPAAAAALPPVKPPAIGETVCRLDTDRGVMVIQFFPGEAPRHVAQFQELVRSGFYDGKRFYRVVAGHVIQAGDGGESDRPTIKAEFNAHPHIKGAVGLARGADPDSGSTEFYICHAPRPHLDGRYTVFGRVVAGLEVLDRIAATEVTEKWVGDDAKVAFHEPRTPVVINGARLVQWPLEQAPATKSGKEGP